MNSMNIVKKLTPNKYNGRNGWKPDMIVCHITEGSYEGSISWLCNPASKASAHFVVGRDGRITQLVELTDTAWCNGTSTDPNSSVYYGKSSLEAVRERKTNANYYTISIEHEGYYSQTGGNLTSAQLTATIDLIKYIRSEVKRIYGIDIPADREHIVGHYQINPVTKPNCPGEKFPFDYIIVELNRKEAANLTWKEIIKKVASAPEEWENAITVAVNAAKADGNLGALEQFKYLPELIEKIYNSK